MRLGTLSFSKHDENASGLKFSNIIFGMNEPDHSQTSPGTSAQERDVPRPLTDAAKEQIKLRATFLNGIAIATFGVGGLAPVVTALSRDDISGGTIGSLFVLSLVCLAVSGVIHSHAYRHLNGLDP